MGFAYFMFHEVNMSQLGHYISYVLIIVNLPYVSIKYNGFTR